MAINDLLSDGKYIIVLDTNVLLNVYRYSPEFSEFALECLRRISDSIYLPATVRLEFGKHCRSEFSKMEKRVATAGQETEKQIASAKQKILKTCDNLERLQFPDIDELRNVLAGKIDAVQKELDDFFEDRATLNLIQHSWAGTDYMMQLVQSIDSSGRIMPSPTQEDIYRWCEDGEKRYKNEVPPGFKDAKNKDGVRKYSDLILWNEILRFAKMNAKDVIFVTDDVKADWWETVEGNKQFHNKLIEEFEKTGQHIAPYRVQDFFNEVSIAYGVEKTDAVEIALRMTDEDYCIKVAEDVFDEASGELAYNAMDYISESSTGNIGSEGIDEFEITDHEFIRAERVERNDNTVVYEFSYKVTLAGTSFEYWGRDEDTRDVIRSDGRDHVFEGTIVVQVRREAEVFLDFEDDNSFETAVITDGCLEETEYADRPEPPGELGYCPDCGVPLNVENEGGNGFCINCAWNH